MADSPARWLPTDTADIIRNPQAQPLTDILRAYGTLIGFKDAFVHLIDGLHDHITTKAAYAREDQGGGKWRGVATDEATVYDVHTKRQVVVAEPEACAAWLAAHLPEVHAQCVIERDTGYEVDGPAFETAMADLAAWAWDVKAAEEGNATRAVGHGRWRQLHDRLEDAVRPVHETIVDGEALVAADGVHAIRGRAVTDHGEVIPGVTVIPPQFKHVRVDPAREYRGAVAALAQRAITGGDTSDE